MVGRRHLLYVDSPVNTGFSYSSSTRDVAKSERVVARDLLEFLWAFLLRHPELADAEVFITGESQRGHYVPAFARGCSMRTIETIRPCE